MIDQSSDLLFIPEGQKWDEAHERLHDRHVGAHVRRVNPLQQRQQLHTITAHRREVLEVVAG